MRTAALGHVHLALGGLALLCGCASEPLPSGTIPSLLDAEAVFEAEARASGLRAAFTGRLAAGAVLFDPTPTDARAALERGAKLPERGTWRPFRADIAESGDLGYTAGHWTEGEAGGRYLTVWRFGAEAQWRVAITARTAGGPAAEVASAPVTIPTQRGWVRAHRRLYQEAARVAMLKADRDMAMRSLAGGLEYAVRSVAADSAVFLRDAAMPVSGSRAAAYLAAQTGIASWIPVGAKISRTGDLGYTYGLQTIKESAADTSTVTSAYVRIWKAKPDSTWQLDVDLATEIR